MRQISLDHVRAALALSAFDAAAAQFRMAPEPRPGRLIQKRSPTARQASVLILLFPGDAGLTLVLTQRSTNPKDVHSGQISLPGGARESGEAPVQTALRETREELGVEAPIKILGMLTSLYIPPSDFEVHPVVGYVGFQPTWKPDSAEVEQVVECPVGWLLEDACKVTEEWDFEGIRRRVPWYDVHGHKVWGATAIILSEFEQRLRNVLDGAGM